VCVCVCVCCFRRVSNVPDLSDPIETLYLTQLFSPVLKVLDHPRTDIR